MPLYAAHRGYSHQDAVSAYLLATLLLPRRELHEVILDKKANIGDRFDDLDLIGSVRTRVQIKSHQKEGRRFQLSALSTKSIDFRLDHVVESAGTDPTDIEQYRLFTTFGLH